MSRFTMIEGVAKLRADQVRIGDLLDFEGDKFADPNGNGLTATGHYEPFEFEFAVVNEITQEGPGCIVLHTSQGDYGFPPDHLIDSTLEQPKAQFYYCGGCGHWHPPEFMGDCRDDANRFTTEDLEKRYGFDGFEPVNPEDAAADGAW